MHPSENAVQGNHYRAKAYHLATFCSSQSQGTCTSWAKHQWRHGKSINELA